MDDRWKRKWEKKAKKAEKKGLPPPPKPKTIRIANMHATLQLPGQPPVSAVGAGAAKKEVSMSEYSETGRPCPDPEKGGSYEHWFVFALPADADEKPATFRFRGAEVPLTAPEPDAPAKPAEPATPPAP